VLDADAVTLGLAVIVDVIDGVIPNEMDADDVAVGLAVVDDDAVFVSEDVGLEDMVTLAVRVADGGNVAGAKIVCTWLPVSVLALMMSPL